MESVFDESIHKGQKGVGVMVRIRLKRDLPVDPKHGMVADRILQATRVERIGGRGAVKWWVADDCKQSIGVLSHEAEEVAEG